MKIRLYFIALSCYSLLMGCSNENVVQTSLEVKVESNLKEVDLEIARPLYSISVPEISDPLVLGDSSQHTAVPAPTPSLVGWDTI